MTYSTCEHPVDQPIRQIIYTDYLGNEHTFTEGVTCTRIEATYKSGEYSNIPYVRVWDGDHALAEFCQHKLLGVFFGKRPATALADKSIEAKD